MSYLRNITVLFLRLACYMSLIKGLGLLVNFLILIVDTADGFHPGKTATSIVMRINSQGVNHFDLLSI